MIAAQTENKYSLILASRSPRRKELLSYLNIPFNIITLNIPEISQETRPDLVVKDLAKQKALAVAHHLQKGALSPEWGKMFFPVIVGSDTIVALDNEILGIPRDEAHAYEMLRKLSGKSHQVHTGVYIYALDIHSNPNSPIILESNFSCSTEVCFAPIPEDLLKNYIDSKDPFDKAGAYGIQGQALSFISDIKGSYSNVVGFPLHEFFNHFKQLLRFENKLNIETFFQN
jgi:septum formation protein